MTVVRLTDGSILLHSPIPLSKQLQGRLEVLGPVRHILSPNKFHHLFMGDCARLYPQAKLYASPALAKKRNDLSFHGVLKNSPEAEWQKDLDQIIFEGNRMMEEVVFFHRLSRTLILADLGFNIPPQASILLKIVGKFSDVYNRFGPAPWMRFTMKDKKTAQESLKKILNWDFDRIIIAHGPGVEKNGKTILQEAYRWLL